MQYIPHAIAVFMALLLGSAVDENRMLKDENTQLTTRVSALQDKGKRHIEASSCTDDTPPQMDGVFFANSVEFSANAGNQ